VSRPCGKAKRSNILALFTLTGLKMMYLAKRFIAPAIHLFINRYSQATTHHLPMIYLSQKLSVKLHKEAGELLMHSILLCLQSFISPRFYCIDHHQHLFSLSLQLWCWPNQSRNSSRGTCILLVWVFRIVDAIVLLVIRFIVCCTIVFAVIWIIQVAIPVKLIFSVRNPFWCANLITFYRMTVDSPDSADI